MLTNARDALNLKYPGYDANKKITLDSRVMDIGTKKMVELRIRDEGVGIPDELLHKIFDPFFTTKPVNKGTGLGLAISYSIISEHNGQLLVDSKLGEYTIFTIKLPILV